MATLTLAIDPTPATQGARVVKNDLDDIKRKALQAEDATDDFGISAGRSMTVAAQGANLAAEGYEQVALSAGMARMAQRNLQFQLIDIAQTIPMAFQSPIFFLQQVGMQGAQIAQIYSSDQGGVGRAFKEAALMVGSFAMRLAPIAAVIGAVAGAVTLFRNSIREATGEQVTFGDVVRATWQVFTEGIYSKVGPAIGWMRDIIGTAIDWIGSAFKALINGVIRGWHIAAETIRYALSLASDSPMTFGNLQSNISATMNNDFAGALFSRISDVAAGFASARSAADAAGSSIANAANQGSDAWAGLRGEVDPMADYLRNAQMAAMQFGTMFGNAFTSLIDGSKSLNESLGDILGSLGRMAANRAFQSIFSTILGGGMGGGFGGFMASGGSVAGNTPYIVGEKGPELFVPSSSGQIVPNNQMGGMGGGVQFSPVINVDARGAGPGVGNEVRREIDSALDSFSRFKLPARVKQIQGDPYASGY